MRTRVEVMLLIGVGAALGANMRYLLGQAVALRLGIEFPYGTLLINVLGSLGIGLVLGLLATPYEPSTAWRLLLVTGLLGGFTTFSTFSYETYTLLTLGHWQNAFLYATGSIMAGLLATVAGVQLSQRLAG